MEFLANLWQTLVTMLILFVFAATGIFVGNAFRNYRDGKKAEETEECKE